MKNFWVKTKSTIKIWLEKNLYLFKNEIIYNFMIFVPTTIGRTKSLPPPPSFFGAVFGSGIRDKHPGTVKLDSGYRVLSLLYCVRRRGEADPGGRQPEDQAEGADQPERRIQRQQRRHDREGRDRGGGSRPNGGTSTTWFVQVLRIRDTYPGSPDRGGGPRPNVGTVPGITWLIFQCCGSEILILDPDISIPDPRSREKLYFMKVIGQKTYLQRFRILFERWKSGLFVCVLWSISLPLDPDPHCQDQGCGSGPGSVLDPYSIGSVDPDPYSEYGSGSGSRRAKMTQKSRQ
jgi:hypothetical protein